MATAAQTPVGMDVGILESWNEPGFMVDGKRTITWANQAFYDTFQLTAAQVIGQDDL